MVWLACRKAWILSRLSFSASCTLVVNPPACHPLQAHLVLESHLPFRLILYWTRLGLGETILFRYNSKTQFRHDAPVAQLDRVLGYEPRGWEFDSLRAHHIYCLKPLPKVGLSKFATGLLPNRRIFSAWTLPRRCTTAAVRSA